MVHWITRFLFVVMLALPLAARAQETPAPDYDAWNALAVQAESALADGSASDRDFVDLLGEVADWRTSFLDAQSANDARIETLRAQITALGEPPVEGETELPDIAERRAALNAQLDQALGPVKAAEEAYTRANGLIGEIDALLLSRQTEALTALGPSPLNPTLWPAALSDLSASGLAAWSTSYGIARSASGLAEVRRHSASIALYLLLALVLVTRARHWSVRLTSWVRGRVSGTAGRNVSGFVASLSEIALPALGLYALSEAARVSSVLGPRGEVVFLALPLTGLAYFFSRWIVLRLFAGGEDAATVIELPTAKRVEVSGHAAVIAVAYGLHFLLADLAQIDGFSAGTSAVLEYPLIVVASLSLLRLFHIVKNAAQRDRGTDAAQDEGAEPQPAAGQGLASLILGTINRVVTLIAIAAPILGAIGYMSAAKAVIYPTILSLALLGLLAVAARLLADMYTLLVRRDGAASEALFPVLMSFGLVLLSVPLFARIWGARPDQIWEVWARLREGISIGDARISVTDFLTFAIVFSVGFGLTRLVKAALRTSVLPKTQLDLGGKNAVVAGVGYLGIFLSTVFAITTAGIDLSSLAIVAGALSVGIGFGLQNIVSNFVSGIILLIERPISEGDWIEVGGQMGFVRDISVRSTRVETFDRTDVIVPNADLISGQVINYTRGNMIGRVVLPVGVAYGTDTRRVEAILQEIAEAQPMVTMNPPPQVVFLAFGADALEFEVRAILRDVTFVIKVTSDMNHEIARRFTEEGIEIPFAQRDIWLRNPEVLQGGGHATPHSATTPAIDPAIAAASEKTRRATPPSKLDIAPEDIAPSTPPSDGDM